MKPESTFERMEKTTWLRVFEDGIWDIALGLMLLAFGLSVITRMTAIVMAVVFAGLISVAGAKKGVTEPRIGRVRFRGRRGRRLGDVTWLLAALSVAGLLVFLFIAWTARGVAPAWAITIRNHFLIVIALIWGGAAGICGWLLELRRFYWYGVLIAATLIGSDLTSGYSFGVALIACGGLIALVGLALLFRFVRRYPRLPTKGAVDE